MHPHDVKNMIVGLGGLTTLGSMIWMVVGDLTIKTQAGPSASEVGLIGFCVGVGLLLVSQLLHDQ